MALRLTDTEARRFVDKVRYLPETGCWVWTGALTTGNPQSPKDLGGYGKFYLRGRTVLAHRVMHEAVAGALHGTTDHLCRNRACVRPRCFEDVPLIVNLLRGHGIFAQNARKVVCKRGHPFTRENTGTQKGTGRFCRTCRRADYRRFHTRQRTRMSMEPKIKGWL